MFRVIFTISAFFQNFVKIHNCKIQVTQHGIHYLMKYSWCDLYPKRQSVELVQTLCIIIVNKFVHFLAKGVYMFNTRLHSLNLTKKDTDDYTFASVVNNECEKFKLNELTPDMFKCFIFVWGITAPKDVEIISRLLSKQEQDSKLTLKNIVKESQWIINFGLDKIEERDILHIHSVGKKEHSKKELLKGLEDLEVGGRVENIQTTTLLRTARILRRVLETWGDLLSLKLQWKTIS